MLLHVDAVVGGEARVERGVFGGGGGGEEGAAGEGWHCGCICVGGWNCVVWLAQHPRTTRLGIVAYLD